MNSTRKASQRMALCGLLAALSVVLLSAGSIIPLATFCCPVLAMLCALPVQEEYGTKTTLVFYGAVSVLALLLCADKEVALLYTFLGWYPAVRTRLDAAIAAKALRAAVKLALFCAAVSAMYTLAILVLGMGYLADEYAAEGQAVLAVTVVLACIVWLLLDNVLQRFTKLYHRKWRRKIFHS